MNLLASWHQPALYTLSQVILPRPDERMCYYHAHFTDEENKARDDRQLAQRLVVSNY